MIYISSFNKKLYDATAKAMLNSFYKYNPESKFIVYYEDDELLDDLKSHKNVVESVNIGESKFLLDWLENNKDIIPKELGGAFSCDCDTSQQKTDWQQFMGGHKNLCPAGGFRRRASQWFRKVASWKEACDELKYGQFVWIDCDTILKKHLSDWVIDQALLRCPIRFHYGILRRSLKEQRGALTGIESGIVMFDLDNGGEKVIKYIEDQFVSGKFRDQPRWDDAWLLTIAAEHFKWQIKGDLHPKSMTNNPMDDGPLSEYLDHFKGSHWREHDV